MKKTCKKCGVAKSQESFAKSGFSSSGTQRYQAVCFACTGRTGAGAPVQTPSEMREKKERVEELKAERSQSKVLAEDNARLNKLLDTMRAVKPAKPMTFVARKFQRGTAVPMMVFSDSHVEEYVDGKKIQNINHYDLAVAEKRAKNFFVNGLRLVDMAARDSRIEDVVVAILGDTFSNGIHDELLETNQLGPTKAVQFVVDLLTSGIQYLLDNSDLTLTIPCVVGNHGRLGEKLRFKTAIENNMEYLAYQWIASHFRENDRVKFEICPGTMQLMTVFDDYLVRFVHGYEIKSKGGVGGITIPIRKKIAAWDNAQHADLTIMGHFHQMLDGGNFMVNGSLIGYSEYCQVNGFSPEKPKQIFTLLHSRDGGEKTIVAPIWLD